MWSAQLALVKHGQSSVRDAAVAEAISDDLFYEIWLGMGFGLLEQLSGQVRPGLVHPSIWNGMVYAGTVAAAGETQVSPVVREVLAKAREGGYSAFRHQLTPGEVFAHCDFGG